MMELLCLDADTGELEKIADLTGPIPVAAFDREGLWIGSSRDDMDFDTDPVGIITHYGFDGHRIGEIRLPGQVDGIAVDDSTLWVSGFRRSRQMSLITALGRDGSVLGEADLSSIDLSRWTQPVDPAPLPPTLVEYARSVRDVVEESLTTEWTWTDRFGDTGKSPPIDPAFHLEAVQVQGTSEAPEIAVLFKWDPEEALFGLSYEVLRDEEAFGVADSYILVYVQENLQAGGYGVRNATRDVRDGVTWLTWPR